MIRSIRSTLGKTLVPSAFALGLLVTAAGTFADQESGGSEHQKRHHNDDRDVGLKGHGFVTDNGVFTTIDIPGARSFTVVSGINASGDTAGGYADQRGRPHGFLRRRGEITTIDFPGAQGTFAARVNDVGQVVGFYGTEPNVPAASLPHGFLLDIATGVFTTIDVPGAIETRPFGINNAGQIVGEYVDAARTLHGFLFVDGVYTTIDAPDSTSTQARDIDDSGRIVGISFAAATTTGSVRGFLRDAQGTFTAIDAPAAPPPPGRPEPPTTQPFGINNLGQITGIFSDSEGTHSFLLDDGVFTTIEVPEAVGKTLAFDINDEGQIAGAYDVEAHGVLRDRRGNFTTLDHPDGVEETILTGINNRGQIVGGYLDAEGTLRSFLLDDGVFTTIDVPGALSVGANKINDRGQIVGVYSTLTNRNHAFPAHGFLWDRGVVTLIDVPGAVHTSPTDIDNNGRIVGWYADAAGTPHGFQRDSTGRITTIDVPDAISNTIQGINERGQMIGEYLDADGKLHGYLRDERGVITIIDAPDATQGTLPSAINNRGDIVGTYYDDTRSYGFVLSNGRFTTFTVPGAFQFVSPFDIDDRGQIVGVSF
jgi:probable HAF family extracellular repeat protein